MNLLVQLEPVRLVRTNAADGTGQGYVEIFSVDGGVESLKVKDGDHVLFLSFLTSG